jgi:hypothetical protein
VAFDKISEIFFALALPIRNTEEKTAEKRIKILTPIQI